ncbi:unnamed protein product [Rotaria sp. Silwood2]|nr:unnamed protein product [Rotaria sp. Silwood2]CAF3406703.1 unnamed protein product [Rotaria sp. Silwood2]CAF3523508.1 unnamed protein product [Rotaria sp. Silwood2]CAF4579607.1 unnamed protein product [Rotaria sp. Silwood2]CAF4628101.1 unnamed protein product [Rotaria sp. Silwood2]
MSNHIRINLESILKTSSIINDLINLNFINQYKFFSQKISIAQLNDMLFFAYENTIKLNLLTKRLIECVLPINNSFHSNLFIELIDLFVLHQQKYYDQATKIPNEIL